MWAHMQCVVRVKVLCVFIVYCSVFFLYVFSVSEYMLCVIVYVCVSDCVLVYSYSCCVM